MKKKTRKAVQQVVPCEKSHHLNGPLFGSPEFKAAYCDPQWAGNKGICGPTAVTLAAGGKTGVAFKKVMSNWEGGFHGSALVKDIERELGGLSLGRRRAMKPWHKLALPDDVRAALVFIQWKPAKHWLFLERVEGKLRGACSECGWFDQDSTTFKTYLNQKNGDRVLSYLILAQI